MVFKYIWKNKNNTDMKTKILITLLIFTTLIAKSQLLTVGIKELKVNNINQPISNPINLGTSSTANAKFTVTLTKPSSFSIGDGLLYIKIYNSQNGTLSDLITPINIPSSTFQTTAAAAINVNIQANYISFNSGNYIVATLLSVNTGGAWSSTPISVTKSPSFTITPTSSPIPCNSTASINFTVNSNTNIGDFKYTWNVGNGWSYLGNPVTAPFTTLVNSINLTPTNPNILPSNVTVTPIWNNTSQSNIVSTVTRQTFGNNVAITGNTTICSYPSTVTYSIDNVPGGSAAWSISDTTVAQVISNSGTQVTINILKTGIFTLSATVTNSCNQTKNVSKNIRVGAPYIINTAERPSHCQFEFRAKEFYPLEGSDTTFTWSYVSGTGNASPSNFSSSGDFATMSVCPPFNFRLKLTATTSCSSTEQFVDLWLNNDDEEINRGVNYQLFTIFPNPSSDYVNISLVSKTKTLTQTGKVQADLYNNMGNKVRSINLNNNKGTISLSGLLQGIYTLKIIYDSQVESHQIIKK